MIPCFHSTTDGTNWVETSQYVGFTSTFFDVSINQKGIPYIAADSAMRLIVLSYDGSKWQRVGEASRIKGNLPTLEPLLAFGSLGQPCVSIYRQPDLVRCDGAVWTDIWSKAPGIAYQELHSDEDGTICSVSNRQIARYRGDTGWTSVSIAGINPSAAFSTVPATNSAGTLYAGFGGYRDSTEVYRFDSTSWLKFGRTLSSERLLNSTILIGQGRMPYLILEKVSGPARNFDLVRFDGADWVNVDTTGLYTIQLPGGTAQKVVRK